MLGFPACTLSPRRPLTPEQFWIDEYDTLRQEHLVPDQRKSGPDSFDSHTESSTKAECSQAPQ